MAEKIKWSELEKRLAGLDKPALIQLVRDLFDTSTDNRVFLATRFLRQESSEAALEPYRTRIEEQFFPKRGFGKLKLAEARRAIREYRRATGDVAGTLELMLTFVEDGTSFTCQYGDIDAPFYQSLDSVLGEFARLLQQHAELYPRFQSRLRKIEQQASNVGWGYSEWVTEVVEELESLAEEG